MTNNRISLLGIIVKEPSSVDKVNTLLHEYRSYIIGRMGVPHQEGNLSIISVVLKCDQDKVSALSGKLGVINGISAKVLYAN
ncbi:MAG: iron-only hydrogenase system regulator [Mycoplasmataceae bacterium]|jgi:putative iron-only hydrogenase system regulator|nr:iron-only hydrogenase system regulator [Mycoplasmataceae bacterium]